MPKLHRYVKSATVFVQLKLGTPAFPNSESAPLDEKVISHPYSASGFWARTWFAHVSATDGVTIELHLSTTTELRRNRRGG